MEPTIACEERKRLRDRYHAAFKVYQDMIAVLEGHIESGRV